MKLRNKKTGEIADVESIGLAEFLDGKFGDQVTLWWKEDGSLDTCRTYNSLAELNAEWEDAPEEPKGSALDLMILTLTNFIENEPDEDKVDLEDCKQMLDRLKAWRRLKDKGFKFDGLTFSYWGRPCIEYTPGIECIEGVDYLRVDSQVEADLDLLFRAEE